MGQCGHGGHCRDDASTWLSTGWGSAEFMNPTPSPRSASGASLSSSGSTHGAINRFRRDHIRLVMGALTLLEERTGMKASRYDFHLKDYEGVLEWINEYKPNPNGRPPDTLQAPSGRSSMLRRTPRAASINTCERRL